MPTLRWMLVVVTAFVGGIIGGVLGARVFDAGEAEAQKPNGVNAQEFLLLDPNGKARAGLGLDQNGEVGLILTSKDGSRKLSLSPDEPVAIKLTDRSGRVLWSAP
ncbi:MAG TPA: hypothetical protein VFS39_14460 [Nitrospira sp.]|nr:hypothetical protein [Nitrospira sp.]